MIKTFLTYLHYLRVKIKLNRKSELIRILRELKPNSILEIGVDEGETAFNLITNAVKFHPKNSIKYIGVDLFSDLMSDVIAKREVSQIPHSRSQVENKLKKNFVSVNLKLIEGDSNMVLKTMTDTFDFIFIDGGHSYETVKRDFELSIKLLNQNGIIVLDDYTNAKAAKIGYGVRRLVDELDPKIFDIKISRFPDLFLHDWGLLATRIVTVRILTQSST